jgi:predicted MPP superfamily phosphohydrolase
MFLILIIAVSTLLHAYVYWRLQSIPYVTRILPRKVFLPAFITLWLISFIAHPLGHFDLGLFGIGLEWLGLYWLGSIFIVFTTLLLTDIATGFGYLFPRFATRIRGAALIVAFGFVLLAFVQGIRAPVVENYEVRLANLPPREDGTVIVVLSDLHIGTMLDPNWLAARANQVAALKPDFLFLVGDLLEGHGSGGSTQELQAVLPQLKATKGVYWVLGNHERYLRADNAIRLLQSAGFHLLRDSWLQASPSIVVAGIDDSTVQSATRNKENPFLGILADRPEDVVTVLLSHRPELVREAAESKVNIMFSGHTHGGQIWPFGEIIRFLSGYLEGRYDVEGMSLFVNRGTGTWGPRMRLWKPGEILCVTLRASE